jgi:hypothetical protein
MKMKRILFWFCLPWLLACGQTPFPDAQLQPVKQPSPHAEGYELTFEEVMEFHQGQSAEYAVKASVPAPGTPIVEVKDLPDGATYSANGQRLAWRPEAKALKATSYRIHLVLKSSLDPSVSITRAAVLLVYGSKE